MIQGLLVVKFTEGTILPDVYEMLKENFENAPIIDDMTFIEVKNKGALSAILKLADAKGNPYKE